MAVWDIDLSNRAGARGASYQSALAAYVYAGMTVLGGLFALGVFDFTTTAGKIAAAQVALQLIVALVAGFMLRDGRGAFWGVALAAFMVINMIGGLVAGSIGGVILTGLLLLVLVNGLRGTFALRGEGRFADDDIDVFH